MTKWIYLGNDKFTCLDDEDFERLGSFLWCLNNGGYAIRWLAERKIIVLMHRQILDLDRDEDKIFTDHRNRVRLDNRRNNLRLCSTGENRQNTTCKGYYFDKSRNQFSADIKIDGVRIRLGRFDKEEDAAAAYRQACESRGEFSVFADAPEYIPPTPEEMSSAMDHRKNIEILSEDRRKQALLEKKAFAVINSRGQVFRSCAEASRVLKLAPRRISLCCEGKIAEVGGMSWKFQKTVP